MERDAENGKALAKGVVGTVSVSFMLLPLKQAREIVFEVEGMSTILYGTL